MFLVLLLKFFIFFAFRICWVLLVVKYSACSFNYMRRSLRNKQCNFTTIVVSWLISKLTVRMENALKTTTNNIIGKCVDNIRKSTFIAWKL